MLTGGGENGNIKSSQKAIGKNGGTLRAEDMPQIQVGPGQYGNAVPGSRITKIYNFAGKDTGKPLRVEEHLIRQYGGEKGQWQHTTGDVLIPHQGLSRAAEVHWFQEPTVGIVRARVKRWR